MNPAVIPMGEGYKYWIGPVSQWRFVGPSIMVLRDEFSKKVWYIGVRDMSLENQMVERVKVLGCDFIEMPVPSLLVDSRDIWTLVMTIEELGERLRRYEEKFGPMEPVKGSWFTEDTKSLIERLLTEERFELPNGAKDLSKKS